MGRGDIINGWCILRTSGAKTLALADSLAAAKYEVWTPRQAKTRHRPNSPIKIMSDCPIAPSTVLTVGALMLPPLPSSWPRSARP